MTTERARSSELRELVQQTPMERASRGRNGVFTATRVQVQANESSWGYPGYVTIDAYSRRNAPQAPLQLVVSLEDAVVLAEQLIEAVKAVLPVEPVAEVPVRACRLDHEALRQELHERGVTAPVPGV